MARARLFGREAERTSLTAWLAEAHSGSPRVVVCTGEPGIGKTRLAEEAAEIARSSGTAVAWGFADDTAGAPPYWMWRQVLRDLKRDVDGIGGALDTAVAPSDDAARFRLFESVSDELHELASKQSVLIVLDDIHWADEASLLLLRHAARRLRRERLLLLVNCRELVGRPGEVVLDLCRAPVTRTLALSGLSVSSVQAALGGLTATEVDEATAESARALTGGNPLFVLELSRAMQSGRTDHAHLPLTASVRDAIAARLVTRSEHCRKLLVAASVLGRHFLPDLAGSVAALTRLEQAGGLDEAVGANLVEAHGDRYRFVHALVRDAILADVEPAELAELHRRAADAVVRHGARTGSDAYTVAQHLLWAAGHESSDASMWCERAGDEAMRQLAYEDAARWYRDALRIGGSSLTAADRCRLLLGAGAATNRSGDLGARLVACVEAAELARSNGLPDVLAKAALVMEATGQSGFDITTRRLCDEALAVVPESDVVMRARLRARFAATYVYLPDPAVALAASDDALDLARQSGDPSALAEACRSRLAIASGPENLAERQRLADLLEQVGVDSEDAQTTLGAHLAHVDTAFERGDLAEVATRLEAATAACDRVGGPVARFLVLHSRAALAQAQGRFVEARAAIDEAFAAMAAGQISARFHTRAAVLGMMGRHVGQDDDSLGAAGYRDAPPGMKEAPGVIVLVAYAAALVSAGRLDEAREVYRSAGPTRTWRVAPHVTLLVPALGIAVASVVGETSDVERFAAALEPFTGHHVVSGVGAITYGGPVELWLGVAARRLGEMDRAVERLREAVSLCVANGARGYEVEAATELAATLTARDAPEDAVAAEQVAARVMVSARELGMAPFVARLERWAAPTAAAAGPLTRRQLEVAELVAAGLTNREIAGRLTLSERTAENHVQHIMLKLGVPNRSAIAVWWVTQHNMSTPVE